FGGEMRLLTATLLWGAMVTLAAAAPAQCTVTGYDTFDCDVVLDGGGLTFALPDGSVFAFTLETETLGSAFIVAADAKPGQLPQELHAFRPVADSPGCWARDEDFAFCVLVQQ